MRVLGIIVLYLVSIQLAASQNEAANWIFGNNAWVEFTPNGLELRNGARINMYFSSASYSENGFLKFYTDGMGLRDGQHNLVPTFRGQRTVWSDQAVFIFKHSLLDSTYFVASMEDVLCRETNLCARPPGVLLSQVTQTNRGYVVKDSLLSLDGTQSLALTQHANGRDFWLVGHKFKSADYFSILVTQYGVDTIVYSTCGPYLDIVIDPEPRFRHDTLAPATGVIKISPDGRFVGHSVKKSSVYALRV